MANFKSCSHYSINDNYYTPKIAWGYISHIIPKEKRGWECCMLGATESNSIKNLNELGFNVFGDTNLDMLENEPNEPYEFIITNPPFNKDIKQKIYKRLVDLDKPFILLLNSLTIHAKYLREIFKDKLKDLQVVFPRKKINYEKLGEGNHTKVNNCSFMSVFLVYKFNLPIQDLWC
jgi:hypothetical protein